MPTIDAVQHRFEAQALTVCHAGPVTSLRLQLAGQSASIVVLLPTKAFVEKKNSEADDNGSAWPVFTKELLREESPAPVVRKVIKCGFDEKRVSELERGWLIFRAQPTRTIASIAREIAETDHAVIHYFKTRHACEFADLQQKRKEIKPSTRVPEIAPEALEKAYDEHIGGMKLTALARRLGLSVGHLSKEFSYIRIRRKEAAFKISA